MKHIFLLLAVLFFTVTATASDFVTASIRPLHSIIKFIGADEVEVKLLLDGGKVHNVRLKPSMMKNMMEARAIFYIDGQLETFIPKALAVIPDSTMKVKLSNAPDINFIYEDQRRDLHLWLSLANAKAIASYVTDALAKLYPAKRKFFAANLAEFIKQADRLDANLKTQLNRVKTRGFIVFHPAFDYFIRDYDLKLLGAVAHDHHMPLAGKTLSRISRLVKAKKVKCAFSEPVMNKRLFARIAGDIKTARLDPLGVELPVGKDLYFRLMEKIGDTFYNCLDKD